MRTTLLAAASVAVLVSAQAEAQKVAVVVLSANPRQAPLAGKVAQAIEDNLARSRDLYHWRDLVASKAPSVAGEAALKQKMDETLAVLKSNDPTRAPIAELQAAMRAAAPTAATADIQAAQAAMGAIAWIMGDVPTAEQRLIEALSYDPTLRPMEVADPPGFAELWERARFTVNEHARGELSITSDPSGARAVVDGAFKGTTPIIVQGLTSGPHLVQLDLFGYALTGEIIKISGPESTYSARLGPTDLIPELELRNAIIAAAQNENGRFIADLGKKIDVGYLIVGWLCPKDNELSLSLAAVRIDNGHVLASQELSIEGDEFGQAGPHAASIANALLEGKNGKAKDAAGKKAKPKDPLDGRDGTEDWQ